jgi:hypothetical protein
MRLIHTVCFNQLLLRKRTIVSRPEDKSWPADFELLLPFCTQCEVFPSFEEIKKELS